MLKNTHCDEKEKSLNSSFTQGKVEFDIAECLSLLWAYKLFILVFNILVCLVALIYILRAPNIYESKGVFAPHDEGGASSLVSQYGGLAAMAGINLGKGGSGDLDQAVVIARSWAFVESLIDNHNLKPYVMAVREWDAVRDQLTWMDSIYNVEVGEWLRDSDGVSLEPSSHETFRMFREMYSISLDEATSMVTIRVEHYSPAISTHIVDLIVKDINDRFRVRDIAEAESRIEFLKSKIKETSLADMQAVFYEMIQAQMQTLMLAEASEQYLLHTVIPPKVPELKSKPRRAIFMIVVLIVGCLFSIFFVLFWRMLIQFLEPHNAYN